MKSSPAFQFYAADFLVGTAEMTPEEVGAYIRLLCYQWAKGSLPNDPQKLSSLAGCTCNALAQIMHKFSICTDGTIQNKRMEEVRSKQDAFRDSRAKNADSGWKNRKNTRTCNALALHKEDRREKIEEEVQSTEKKDSQGGCKGDAVTVCNGVKQSEAELIYQKYPLKSGHGHAIKAIQKALKSYEFEFLMKSTVAYALARNGNIEYVPHPSTWFNGEHFLDDPKTWIPKHNGKPQIEIDYAKGF